jgi:hypothetical protein
MALYFINPGLVEIRGLTTFGVHVKKKENPIGTFGTGFKYGTGIVLRLGGSVVVYRGLDKYEFFSRAEDIRGKEFQMVYLRFPDGREEPVGMTTEVGKNWEPWMAYREFRCNAADENGFTTQIAQEPVHNQTTIVVDCLDIDLAHQNREKYFLEGSPIHSMEEVELYASDVPEGGFLTENEPATSQMIFLKGVRVGQWIKSALYKYNFTGAIMLTEDRVLSSYHYVDSALRRSYAMCTDEDLLRRILTTPTIYVEGMIDFSYCSAASEQFLNVAEEVIKQKPMNYNISLRRLLHRLRNYDPYEWVDPSVLEAKMLMKAEDACRKLGLFPDAFEIRVVDNLGANVLGECHGKNIYLARKVFQMGTKMVAGTLYEEIIHAQYGHADESRAMQNYLIDRLMTMVEEKTGEPM